MRILLRGRIACLLAVCALAGPAAGRNLKVIKHGEPDATNIRALVATVTAGCKTDREKTIALWGYITRNRYFWWWCADRPLKHMAQEPGYVLDPIKRFNVHGGVICFQVQHSLATMLHHAGIKSRQLSLPGHCILEVWFDGDWHVFDAQVDCSSYFHGDDGQEILSHAEVCSNTTKYIINQANPSNPFFKYDHFGGKFVPWETRAFVATNFYTGSRDIYAVLLSWGHTVDFDLRRPAFDEVFSLPLEPGVSEILRGESELGDAIHTTGTENLSVVTAGRWDRHALAALANGASGPLFDELRSECEFLVVDSSPILPVADTRIVSQHVDAVVLSVFRDVSQAPKVQAACEILEAFGVRSVEAVVTGSSERPREHDMDYQSRRLPA